MKRQFFGMWMLVVCAGLAMSVANAGWADSLADGIKGEVKKHTDYVNRNDAKTEEKKSAVVNSSAIVFPASSSYTRILTDKTFPVVEAGQFQPTVNENLTFGATKIPVTTNFKSMLKPMEKEQEYSLILNVGDYIEYNGPFLGIVRDIYMRDGGITICDVSCEENHGKADMNAFNSVVDVFKKVLGTPHVLTDDSDLFVRQTYVFWQFKDGMFLIRFQNARSYEQAIAKKLAEANASDSRITYDKLNKIYNLKFEAMSEFAEELHGGTYVFFLTPKGIADMKVLPVEPVKIGEAALPVTADAPAQTLDPDRKPVGNIPASVPKNAIFDIATQQVVCYYKGQKFYSDEACTNMIYAHPGNQVGTVFPIPYGEGLFRFTGGRMYKGNSFDNADVVASIVETRIKKGDTLEAKIFSGCVFFRDLEKVDNDRGEDVYTYNASYDNVKRAEIPALYTYKEGKLYRGDSCEDRDCVLVISPNVNLNASRLLFVAMTFVKYQP